MSACGFAKCKPTLQAVAIRLSPSASNRLMSAPTLVYKQALLQQHGDDLVPIHPEINSQLLEGLAVVCEKIAKRHQLFSIG